MHSLSFSMDPKVPLLVRWFARPKSSAVGPLVCVLETPQALRRGKAVGFAWFEISVVEAGNQRRRQNIMDKLHGTTQSRTNVERHRLKTGRLKRRVLVDAEVLVGELD